MSATGPSFLERERQRPPAPHLTELARAILKTVAYADIFDYPLTAAEIHRYLEGFPVSAGAVEDQLLKGDAVSRYLARHQGYYVLSGRQEIIPLRMARAAVARQLWQDARHYGRLIAKLPYVRMVAVTGSLAMNNPGRGADIDLLVVTKDDRLWLCRALVILVVRRATRRGVGLCPNYFLAERALRFPVPNLYAAHEVAQMVPLAGLATYRQLRRLNAWVDTFLPNAAGPPGAAGPESSRHHAGRSIFEHPLGAFLSGWLERWEMGRKMPRFRAAAGDSNESSFSADWCKGHFERHHERTLNAYQARLAALGLVEIA